MSLNIQYLSGNVGSDPEIKTLQSGAKVAKFTLATSEKFTDNKGQAVEQTEWHNIVAWKGIADIVEKYVKKGDKILVVGKSTHRSYEDKNGVKHFTSETVANAVELFWNKKTEGNPTVQSSPFPSKNERARAAEQAMEQDDDNIPF